MLTLPPHPPDPSRIHPPALRQILSPGALQLCATTLCGYVILTWLRHALCACVRLCVHVQSSSFQQGLSTQFLISLSFSVGGHKHLFITFLINSHARLLCSVSHSSPLPPPNNCYSKTLPPSLLFLLAFSRSFSWWPWGWTQDLVTYNLSRYLLFLYYSYLVVAHKTHDRIYPNDDLNVSIFQTRVF